MGFLSGFGAVFAVEGGGPNVLPELDFSENESVRVGAVSLDWLPLCLRARLEGGRLAAPLGRFCTGKKMEQVNTAVISNLCANLSLLYPM